jgi:hypothetical protein
MPKFFTVKEAAAQSGKSDSAIRRIIYPILENPKHPDRVHIEPSPKEALALRMRGENFPWRISDDFLRRIMADEPKKKSGPKSTVASDASASVMIEMLRKELEIKNQQIAAQNQQITSQNELMKGLSERMRESNILIGSLQQRLGLTDGSEKKQTASGDNSEKGSIASQPPPKKTPWYRMKIF